MLKTTTENIEGKKIENYLGVVSGTDIYLAGGVLGGGMANQEKLYDKAVNTAMLHLESKAIQLGADAIVGISVNLVSPGNANNIIVVVTGTAVKVGGESQKEDELPEI